MLCTVYALCKKQSDKMRRRAHVPNSESSNRSPLNRKDTVDTVLLGALSATQVSLLLMLSFVILLSLKGDKTNPNIHARTIGFTKKTVGSLSNSTTSPSLSNMLDMVAKAFDSDNITYWMLPGLNLLPPSKGDNKGHILGKLSPWHEGVDLGVFQDDVMGVIQVQTQLQSQGIVAVESYFGLRMFSEFGYEDARYDFRRPFIDVVYFKEEEGHVISHCCDCEPNTVSACSKKTCDCVVCLAKTHDIFPLAVVQIEGVQSALKAPRCSETLMLRDTSKSLHPSMRRLMRHAS